MRYMHDIAVYSSRNAIIENKPQILAYSLPNKPTFLTEKIIMAPPKQIEIRDNQSDITNFNSIAR